MGSTLSLWRLVTVLTGFKAPYKMMNVVAILTVVVVSSALPQYYEKAAAVGDENYGCQCKSLTWMDANGRIQGNCKTADNTGARWCYVPSYNTCTDLQASSRFNSDWSYEACATPPPPRRG